MKKTLLYIISFLAAAIPLMAQIPKLVNEYNLKNPNVLYQCYNNRLGLDFYRNEIIDLIDSNENIKLGPNGGCYVRCNVGDTTLTIRYRVHGSSYKQTFKVTNDIPLPMLGFSKWRRPHPSEDLRDIDSVYCYPSFNDPFYHSPLFKVLSYTIIVTTNGKETFNEFVQGSQLTAKFLSFKNEHLYPRDTLKLKNITLRAINGLQYIIPEQEILFQ